MTKPFFRFDVETLADMTVDEVTGALATIEAWQAANPDDRTLDSAWRAFRNHRDWLISRSDV